MFIKGVSMLKCGIHDKPSHLLAYEAACKALEDAALDFKDINAIVISSLEWFYTGEMQRHIASQLSSLFKTNIPIISLPAACAGGGTALWTAKKLAENNPSFNNVLVLGVEKIFGHTRNTEHMTDEFMMATESRWEQPEGLNFPGGLAHVAIEYFRKYPSTTMDDLALIAFKNHSNGFNNSLAYFYKKKVTLEQIKNSPVICSPLRLFDCSISLDGAAGCVITKDKTDIRIVGSATCADYLAPFEREDTTTWDGTVITGRQVFEQAAIEPKDIDIAEVHDAFTILELMIYEDLGFCKKGEAYKAVRDKRFNIDGKLPINASGGLKAKGHPISATGLGMIYELVKQLRNECGNRQVNKKLKYALAHNIGGAGGTTTCHILKKIGG